MEDQLKTQNRFFITPNLIFEIDLEKHEILTYLYLLRCANNSTAYPSYETIGRKTGTSRSTALRAVESLIKKGLIVKHERKEKHTKKDGNIVVLNCSNIYEVIIELDDFAKKVVSGRNHSSVREKLGVVSGRNHPSVREKLGVVSERYPINNSNINNSYKELNDKELSINNILSSEEQNDDAEQKPSSVESDDSTKNLDNLKDILSDLIKKGDLFKSHSESILSAFSSIEIKDDKAEKKIIDLLVEQEVITKKQGKSLRTALINSRKEQRVFSPDSIELRASKYLFEKMVENNPNAKVPDFQKWADNIRLMLEQDKRDPKAIAKVIEFSQQDEFWKTVLLSTGSLRENFEKLYMQMTTKQNSKNKKHNIDNNMMACKEALEELKAEEEGQMLEEMEVFEI